MLPAEKEKALIKVLKEFIKVMDSLPACDETPLKVWDVYNNARKVLEDTTRKELKQC